ncbi:MAG TPA: hypothetical protein VEM96_02915 [Pyrinomonadaceae bacterium]|nr:hypothetical protein [Pyrinomonadaceae bacterium]
MIWIANETYFAMSRDERNNRPVFQLWVLLLLFILRVAGQLLVATGRGSFLPPMSQWYSGLLPYRYLLPAQLLIVVLYGKVCLSFTRGQGFLVTPRSRIGRVLLLFGTVYFTSMVIRYPVTMALYPERRWTGGLIPIFFHLVLSAFILLLGRYHYVNSRAADLPQKWAAAERAWPPTTITS